MYKDILPGKGNVKLKNFSASWKKLSFSQKLSVFFLLFLLVSLPVAVIVSLQPTKLFSRADYPITPPFTPSPTSTPRPTYTAFPTTPTPRGTLTPVPTPIHYTPTPTATPIPSWTAIPNETPTPPPIPLNNAPVISTNRLRTARAGSGYRYYVRAYDVDANEDMKMFISNLPAGLSQGGCKTGRTISGGSSIRCPIIGRPEQDGAFRIDVTVFDSRGGYDQSYLPLVVREKSGWRSRLPF